MIKEISYGVIPIRDDKLLLLRVYDTWDFPKGKPEDNELPLDTAKRELFEETNLSTPVFDWGNDYAETIPYKKGTKIARYFMASCQHGDVKLLPNPESGITEHHAFAWLSIDEARERVRDRLHPVISWVTERIMHGRESTETTGSDYKGNAAASARNATQSDTTNNK